MGLMRMKCYTCSSAKASPRSANRWRAMMVLRSRMRHWSSCVSCRGGEGSGWKAPCIFALARKACTGRPGLIESLTWLLCVAYLPPCMHAALHCQTQTQEAISKVNSPGKSTVSCSSHTTYGSEPGWTHMQGGRQPRETGHGPSGPKRAH